MSDVQWLVLYLMILLSNLSFVYRLGQIIDLLTRIARHFPDRSASPEPKP